MDDDRKKAVTEANIRFHSHYADTYDEVQPHFKPENVEQVVAKLKTLARKTGGNRLLDIGCGTGFISHLAVPFFTEICGVDITEAMLDNARAKFEKDKIKNVKLFLASSEKLPFPDGHFDVVTAYGFLHHLPTLEPTLKEVSRVLKEGGILYTDQDPNFYFRESMKSLPQNGEGLSELLEIERKSVCEMVSEVKKAAGETLDAETIQMAEYQMTEGGLKEEELVSLLKNLEFRDIDFGYTWFWQQGRVVHDISPETAIYVENHLRAALPLTKSFFKYVRLEAVK